MINIQNILTTILLCLAASMPTAAQTITQDGITYELFDGENRATMTGLASDNNLKGIVVIPEQIQYKSKNYVIDAIGRGDLSVENSKDIIELSLPGTIRQISWKAFSNCTKLQKLRLNEGIESVVGFNGCTSLYEIEIPQSLRTIGVKAFAGCTSLRHITLPNSLRCIGGEAFCGCTSLSELTLPDSLYYIGSQVFNKCKSLSLIKINESNPYLSTDGKAIFNKDGSILYTAIPLTKYVVPSTVKTLKDYAFHSQTDLASITLNEGLLEIGPFSFGECNSLHTITFPSSLSKLPLNPGLSTCYLLESILVDKRNTHYSSDGTALFNSKKDSLIIFPGGIADYTIPKTVKTIIPYAFFECDSLHNLQFEDGISDLTIASNAFAGCDNLNKIIIGKGITEVGEMPFHNAHINKLGITCTKTTDFYRNLLSGATINQLYAPSAERYTIGRDIIPIDAAQICNETVHSRTIAFNLKGNDLWEDYFSIPFDSTRTVVRLNYDYGEIINNENGRYILRNLWPYQTYTFVIQTFNKKGTIIGATSQEIKTKAFGTYSRLIEGQTYVTLEDIRIDIDPEIDKPVRCALYCGHKYHELKYNSKPQTVTITNLWPNESGHINYIEFNNNGDPIYKCPLWTFETYGVFIRTSIDNTTITPTTYTIKGSVDQHYIEMRDNDANIIDEGWTFDNATISEHGNTLLVSGQTPGTSLADGDVPSYAVIVKNGEDTRLYRKAPSFLGESFPSLELKTIAEAKATSNTVALICATTNMSDDETNAGFEWRRYDAPELVPSSKANCPIIDGVMTGALRNLSANTYYKFRPFYKSNSGKTWYGEWSAFGTADAYVYFDPTVRTFEVNCDNETTATVRAFVIAGSDEIKEQGFEYWKHSSTESTSTRYVATAKEDNHQTIISTGQRMTATLENLEPNTTYSVRAYVTTEHGTTYGEEQIFSTPAPTAIGNVKLDNTQSGEMTVTINKANAQGVDFVVNGTRNEISAKLYSISGTVLSTTSTTDNGSDARNIKMQTQHLQSGMYLLCVTDGVCTKTIRLAIK